VPDFLALPAAFQKLDIQVFLFFVAGVYYPVEQKSSPPLSDICHHLPVFLLTGGIWPPFHSQSAAGPVFFYVQHGCRPGPERFLSIVAPGIFQYIMALQAYLCELFVITFEKYFTTSHVK
jgi:hypothetical protein